MATNATCFKRQHLQQSNAGEQTEYMHAGLSEAIQVLNKLNLIGKSEITVVQLKNDMWFWILHL